MHFGCVCELDIYDCMHTCVYVHACPCPDSVRDKYANHQAGSSSLIGSCAERKLLMTVQMLAVLQQAHALFNFGSCLKVKAS
eukprot:1161639-Pelagomonas_calceolata.AAC.12